MPSLWTLKYCIILTTFRPEIILCGWQRSKHHLTNSPPSLSSPASFTSIIIIIVSIVNVNFVVILVIFWIIGSSSITFKIVTGQFYRQVLLIIFNIVTSFSLSLIAFDSWQVWWPPSQCTSCPYRLWTWNPLPRCSTGCSSSSSPTTAWPSLSWISTPTTSTSTRATRCCTPPHALSPQARAARAMVS